MRRDLKYVTLGLIVTMLLQVSVQGQALYITQQLYASVILSIVSNIMIIAFLIMIYKKVDRLDETALVIIVFSLIAFATGLIIGFNSFNHLFVAVYFILFYKREAVINMFRSD